jgi:glycosyltransferase involved in cell wall biosynthesis
MPEVTFVALTTERSGALVEEWFPGRVLTVSGRPQTPVRLAFDEFISVNAAGRRVRADLVWSLANFGPIFGRPRSVVTTHDAIPFEYPTSVGVRLAMRLTGRHASRVLTDSEDAKRRLAPLLSVPSQRIVPVPLGVSSGVFQGDVWKELGALGLHEGRPIVLSVGNDYLHKNMLSVVRAMAQMLVGDRPLLVLPGRVKTHVEPLVDQLHLTDDVFLPGWVTDDQVDALYAAASLYVCPSLAEGFGLPLVDAMARGCPVLANDIPVLREVGGDAAAYVDATDPKALADSIMSLLTSPDKRAAYRQAGLRHAQGFTWERSAEITAGVLRAALDPKRDR